LDWFREIDFGQSSIKIKVLEGGLRRDFRGNLEVYLEDDLRGDLERGLQRR
jgi:hypothetical protein